MKQTTGFRQILPMAAILTAVLLWGSSFSAMGIVLKDLDPMAAVFLRLLIASICILPFAGRLIPKNRQKGDLKVLGAMVLCQPCLYFLFESRALIHTTSSQAGIISACLPLMVALAARIFLGETLKPGILSGLTLSMAGVFLLTLFQAPGPSAPNPLLGNLLELGAMVSACGYMILVKKLSARYNPWTLTGLQVLGGTLFFLPGLGPLLNADPAIWQTQLILLLFFLGSCVSLLAFGLYNYGISKIEASRASISINLIPVTAVVFGWMFLGEALNLKQILAAGLVLAGVVLSQMEKGKTVKSPEMDGPQYTHDPG